MRISPPIYAFNRGVISRLALARTDQERARLSAEEQVNWMPRVMGSMMLRPGLKYVGRTRGDFFAQTIPFVFETGDLARLELTPSHCRVWVDDALVTRPSVRTRFKNGDFTSTLAHWTDDDQAGAVSLRVGGALGLRGTGDSYAGRWQQLHVHAVDRSVEHAVRVKINQGPVTLKIGDAPGSDNLLQETALGVGWHSLTFTPELRSCFVHLSHRGDHTATVADIRIEGPGPLDLPSPYNLDSLKNVRWAQSRDVIFLACDGYSPMRIERRGPRSWSMVDYEPFDGPFKPENLTRLTIASTNLEGDVTLTASADVFRSAQAGSLLRLTSSGQRVGEAIASENIFTEAIKVTGVGRDRGFRAVRSGAGAATVTLQRSVGAPGVWEDVQEITESISFDDDLDNQIIFYRIGVKAGDFVSGVVNVSLSYTRGAIDGICRITRVASPTVARAIVLKPFGSTDPTDVWAEGAWNDHDGWPTAVGLFEGRLWWGGRGRLWGSVSDAFDSFDETLEGDAGPIAKTITDGPSDVVAWIGVGQRMVIGTTGGVFEARSSSLDEPLTPTACELRRFSTMGAANLPATPVEDRLHFVQRAGRELLEAAIEPGAARPVALRLIAHAPELGATGFVRLATQNQPDARVHCLRANGTAAVLVTDPAEQVRCWIEVETDGEIEDVCVLPDGEEDAVYYLVKRVIGGRARRYYERWALEDQCRGGALNCQADSHIVYEGARTSSVDGLEHLEGKSVVVWADGAPRETAVVRRGAVAISGEPCRAAVIGLPYSARFKSAKLAYGARKGTALAQPKRVNRMSFVLADVHADGMRFGPDYERLDPLPRREAYGAADPDAVYDAYDVDGAPFPGDWSTDARICLTAEAPKPCTVLGVVLDMETIEL